MLTWERSIVPAAARISWSIIRTVDPNFHIEILPAEKYRLVPLHLYLGTNAGNSSPAQDLNIRPNRQGSLIHASGEFMMIQVCNWMNWARHDIISVPLILVAAHRVVVK